jgi:serine/threonine protein phosphatase PrpC
VIDLLLEQRSVQLVVQGATDPGMQRSENQDHFLVADLSASENGGGMLLSPGSETSSNEPSAAIPLGPKGALILVADGMGGAAAGSIASKMATGWIYEELVERWGADRENTPQRFMTGLRDAVEATNAMVHQQSARYPQYRGMGTTVTAAGVLDGFLLLAQVGDSRAYLVRSGVATQLTRDQSLVQELIDAGALTEDEAESSEHRNVILQALGVAPDVQVDLTYQELRRGDTLVICSDGLFRTVQRQEIAQAVAGSDHLQAVCDRLVALANERGGPDNVTVVIARVDGPGLEPPKAEDRVERRRYQL